MRFCWPRVRAVLAARSIETSGLYLEPAKDKDKVPSAFPRREVPRVELNLTPMPTVSNASPLGFSRHLHRSLIKDTEGCGMLALNHGIAARGPNSHRITSLREQARLTPVESHPCAKTGGVGVGSRIVVQFQIGTDRKGEPFLTPPGPRTTMIHRCGLYLQPAQKTVRALLGTRDKNEG